MPTLQQKCFNGKSNLNRNTMFLMKKTEQQEIKCQRRSCENDYHKSYDRINLEW